MSTYGPPRQTRAFGKANGPMTQSTATTSGAWHQPNFSMARPGRGGPTIGQKIGGGMANVLNAQANFLNRGMGGFPGFGGGAGQPGFGGGFSGGVTGTIPPFMQGQNFFQGLAGGPTITNPITGGVVDPATQGAQALGQNANEAQFMQGANTGLNNTWAQNNALGNFNLGAQAQNFGLGNRGWNNAFGAFAQQANPMLSGIWSGLANRIG